MRAHFTIIAVLVGLALGGPALAEDAVLPLPAEEAAEITKFLGAGVVGEALPSKPITDASSLFPLEERASVFRVTSGKNAGQQQTLRTMKGQRPGGNDAWRFELAPSMAAYLNAAAEGDVVMPAVSDSGEGVIVVTTPPNPFVTNGMEPGESRKFSQKVSVNYLDDPTDQRYTGTLEGSYTYIGTYEVTVPAGTFPAVLMRLRYAGKIGPAHTEDTAYYFFAPGTGVVAMISQEDVEAFWVIHIDTSSGKVLASPAAS